MNQQSNLRQYQSGQGMVEYAILLLLTITLVIGGVELASTALASNKTSDAAEAGANEYAGVNKKRIKLQNALRHYSERSGDNDNFRDELDALTSVAFGNRAYLWTNYNECFNYVVSSTDCESEINISTLPNSASIVIKEIDSIDDVGDGDGQISHTELYYAVKYHQTTEVLGNGFDILNEIKQTQDSKAIMLFDHIQLSLLPLDPRMTLSSSEPLLGNHTPANDTDTIRPPACDDTNPSSIFYDHGFPVADSNMDGYIPELEVVPHQNINGSMYPAIYLFNPLPIDAKSCIGEDANRNGLSKMSILVGGYGNEKELEDKDIYTGGLPKANQAYYSQYTRVCLNSGDQYVSCASSAVDEQLLKPPGKYCLADVATDTVDSCPGIDPSQLETSGYYFWGLKNQADQNGDDKFKWIYDEVEPPEFRPVFQLLCNGDSSLSEGVIGDIDNGECAKTFNGYTSSTAQSNIYNVEINVRYRSVFESFFALGMQELQDPNGLGLAYYFYDPSNLRQLEAGEIGVPIVGSELGPKQGDLPTVKTFEDFRGCYAVDVETNQVNTCN